ncbi:MAG: matrixin family metalloprotease [Bryobacteraceae bacterium]|nr:matrixin family metalloprotease [Bryobacteraceae bacterium]
MIDKFLHAFAADLMRAAGGPRDPSADASLAEAYWELQYLSRAGFLRRPEPAAAPAQTGRPECGDEALANLLSAFLQGRGVAAAGTPNLFSELANPERQLAAAQSLLPRLTAASRMLTLEIARLQTWLHGINQNRILRISFTVAGATVAAESQKDNLNLEKVNIAVRQALAYWSAITPLVFTPPLAGEEARLRINFRRDNRQSAELGTASGFISSLGGLAGGSSVTIDCDNELFVDLFLERDLNPVLIGPFDLVALLTHEIGHALGLDHSPDDELAIMSKGIGPGFAKRNLFPFDIREAQRLHGSLVLGETRRANFAQTGALADAPATVKLQRFDSGLVVFGPTGTRALVDVVVKAKGSLINALRLKFTTVSSLVFVNRVETFDGIIPLQQYALSSRSVGNEGLTGRPFDLRLGFLERRTLSNDLLVRMEIFFTGDFGVLQVHEVALETLPQLPVLDMKFDT